LGRGKGEGNMGTPADVTLRGYACSLREQADRWEHQAEEARERAKELEELATMLRVWKSEGAPHTTLSSILEDWATRLGFVSKP